MIWPLLNLTPIEDWLNQYEVYGKIFGEDGDHVVSKSPFVHQSGTRHDPISSLHGRGFSSCDVKRARRGGIANEREVEGTMLALCTRPMLCPLHSPLLACPQGLPLSYSIVSRLGQC